MTPRLSNRPLALAAALTAATLTACDSPDRVAGPQDPLHALHVEAGVLAAVSDAETRLVPALDPALAPVVGDALAELHAALDAGQVRRTSAAVTTLRRLVAAGAPTEAEVRAAETDVAALAPAVSSAVASDAIVRGADLAAVSVLVEAVEQAIATAKGAM